MLVVAGWMDTKFPEPREWFDALHRAGLPSIIALDLQAQTWAAGDEVVLVNCQPMTCTLIRTTTAEELAEALRVARAVESGEWSHWVVRLEGWEPTAEEADQEVVDWLIESAVPVTERGK